MKPKYFLTPTQAAVLRVLANDDELTAAEIGVTARLMPYQVRETTEQLEEMGLIKASVESGEKLHSLASDGATILRAFKTYQGTPPIGTVMPVPSGSVFGSGLSPFAARRSQTTVEITNELQPQG